MFVASFCCNHRNSGADTFFCIKSVFLFVYSTTPPLLFFTLPIRLKLITLLPLVWNFLPSEETRAGYFCALNFWILTLLKLSSSSPPAPRSLCSRPCPLSYSIHYSPQESPTFHFNHLTSWLEGKAHFNP